MFYRHPAKVGPSAAASKQAGARRGEVAERSGRAVESNRRMPGRARQQLQVPAWSAGLPRKPARQEPRSQTADTTRNERSQRARDWLSPRLATARATTVPERTTGQAAAAPLGPKSVVRDTAGSRIFRTVDRWCEPSAAKRPIRPYGRRSAAGPVQSSLPAAITR